MISTTQSVVVLFHGRRVGYSGATTGWDRKRKRKLSGDEVRRCVLSSVVPFSSDLVGLILAYCRPTFSATQMHVCFPCRLYPCLNKEETVLAEITVGSCSFECTLRSLGERKPFVLDAKDQWSSRYVFGIHWSTPLFLTDNKRDGITIKFSCQHRHRMLQSYGSVDQMARRGAPWDEDLYVLANSPGPLDSGIYITLQDFRKVAETRVSLRCM